MGDKETQADVYELKGPEIGLTYRRKDGKLDLTGDDHLLNQQDLDTVATVEPDVGLRLTATLLESSRAGAKITLTVLLPEVRWPPESAMEPATITGVAVVTKSLEHAVSGPPPALQSYDEVRSLEGTASPAN